MDGCTFCIYSLYCLFKGFFRYLPLGKILHTLFETEIFLFKEFSALNRFYLRKIHYIKIVYQAIQGFICLFLAVTCIFSNYHVCAFQVGAYLSQLEAEGRFYKCACVSRQVFLNLLHGKISTGAKSDKRCVCCKHNLLRDKHTIGPDNFSSLLLFIKQFLYPEAVYIAYDEIEIFHLLGAVFL